MSTVASNSAVLCSATEFLRRNDPRTIGMLATTTTTPITEAALATDTRLAAALEDASGIVESAALRGQKYTAADLALIRDSASMGAALLFRIVSDIAWGLLWENRQNKAFNVPPPPSMERSLDWLNDLASGARIFPVQENMDAGHTNSQMVTPIEVWNRDGVVVQADRYYGERAERHWPQPNGW